MVGHADTLGGSLPSPAGQPFRMLVIESTCDETAAAVVDDQLHVLGEVVASQDALHQRFRGVVPEIAARAHLERIIPVIDETIRRAGCSLGDIRAVAVANTPGLAGSLLVGVVAAKTLSWTLGVPLVAINHLHGHVYACRIATGRSIFPCVGFVVSGGHTSLYHCVDPLDFRLLGGTIDDAAGEAFDKVANMLGLPFPGGPALSALAAKGDPTVFAHLPRAMIHDSSRLQFSFSGLKTAVRYQLAGPGRVDFATLEIPDQKKADLAAGFQQAVVDCLVAKARQALRATGLQTLCVGGGVAANKVFRAQLAEAANTDGFELHIAPPKLCTDNAVMGAIAFELLQRGKTASWELDVIPGLER